jgi:inner membrane transporter RhtA
MLTLLPATATIVGVVVLSQMPTLAEIAGILLVAAGVYLHKPSR